MPPYRALLVALGLLTGMSASFAQGVPGFDFNFKPLPGATRGNLPNSICNIPGQTDVACDVNDRTYAVSADRWTPFIQETVNLGGQEYYHVVVGQPDQGFAQEILIKTSSVVFYGNALSDSGGGRCVPGNPFGTPASEVACAQDNNGRNPFGDFSVTGNGSGNPNAVLIRQVMTDPVSGFTQEFLKAELNKKPVITQNLNSQGVVQAFMMDMSNSDYDTAERGKMTNVTTVEGAGTWDADKGLGGSSPATGKNITGGSYTYRAIDPATGFGKIGNPDQQNIWTYGTYLYYDDPNKTSDADAKEFDFAKAGWGVPTDPAQNRPGPPR